MLGARCSVVSENDGFYAGGKVQCFSLVVEDLLGRNIDLEYNIHLGGGGGGGGGLEKINRSPRVRS